jgi:uncharacterized membrane protein YagU involved in acid resistance
MTEAYNEPTCEIGGEGRNICQTVQSIRNEAFRSGTIAALVLIPLVLLSTLLNLNVNEMGMVVIERYFASECESVRLFLFLGLHFLVSWLAAAPLLFLLLQSTRLPAWATGLLYGAGFWLIATALLLPASWQNNLVNILPSLIVHLVYGLSIAMTSRRYVARQTARSGSNKGKTMA